jgi:hypothetical protein
MILELNLMIDGLVKKHQGLQKVAGELKQYRDVDCQKDRDKITALRAKLLDHQTFNEKMIKSEAVRHGVTLARLKQKMDQTIHQLHIDAYQEALKLLTPAQLETYATYKNLLKQSQIYETSLAKLKAQNDLMANHNLEIAQMLDRADWSISYYNRLFKMWKEGKYEIPLNDNESVPFFVSVLKTWESLKDEKIHTKGQALHIAPKTGNTAGSTKFY